MKLAWRLIAVVATILLGVLVFEAYLEVAREQEAYADDMKRDGRLIAQAAGAAMRGTSSDVMPALEIGDHDEHVAIDVVALAPSDGALPRPHAPAKVLGNLSGQETLFWHDDDRAYTYMLVPGHPHHALEISESLAPLRVAAHDTVMHAVVRSALLGGGLLALTLVLGVAYVGRPVRRLAAMARKVGEGDLTSRVVLKRRDELQELAEAMNGMCDGLGQARDRIEREAHQRIAAIEQLRHADRLATVGQLAAGVAHELGSPLNVVAGRAKMIATGEIVGDDASESAQIIGRQADRMTLIIRGLLDFSRRRAVNKTVADVRIVAEETLRLLAPIAHKRAVTAGLTRCEGSSEASVDPVQLQQVLTNLVMNAIQAVAAGGHVFVTTAAVTATPPPDQGGAEGDYVRVTVEDDGPGIRVEDRKRIFEPFFTTKEVGQGTGLGLAVSYGLVKENGGWIDVESRSGHGACFSMYLPSATMGSHA